MKLIAGLGNIGKYYENTRHNIGFKFVDALANELGSYNFSKKFQGEVATINKYGEKIILLKPHTYMNKSGNSIYEAISFYKLSSTDDLIVIYDDMDLPVGKIRLRAKGSAGGHNGIKSIISHIGNEFSRIKIGIDKPRPGENVVNYVLDRIPKKDNEKLEEAIKIAINATTELIQGENISKIMTKYN